VSQTSSPRAIPTDIRQVIVRSLAQALVAAYQRQQQQEELQGDGAHDRGGLGKFTAVAGIARGGTREQD
jgi:hypothetical protein